MLILYNIEGFLNTSEGKNNPEKTLNDGANAVIFVWSHWAEQIFIPTQRAAFLQLNTHSVRWILGTVYCNPYIECILFSHISAAFGLS